MNKIRFVFIVSMLFAGTPLLCMNSSVKSNGTEITKKDVGGIKKRTCPYCHESKASSLIKFQNHLNSCSGNKTFMCRRQGCCELFKTDPARSYHEDNGNCLFKSQPKIDKSDEAIEHSVTDIDGFEIDARQFNALSKSQKNECPICGIGIAPKSYKFHILSCEKAAAQTAEQEKAEEEENFEEENNSSEYICEILVDKKKCGKKYNSARHLNSHICKSHPEQAPLKCKEWDSGCKFACFKQDKLNHHISSCLFALKNKVHEPRVSKQTAIFTLPKGNESIKANAAINPKKYHKEFICPYCKKTQKISLIKFQSHLNSCSGNNTFMCRRRGCSQVFKMDSTRSTHEETNCLFKSQPKIDKSDEVIENSVTDIDGFEIDARQFNALSNRKKMECPICHKSISSQGYKGHISGCKKESAQRIMNSEAQDDTVSSTGSDNEANASEDETPLLIKIKRCLHCSKLFQAPIFAHHQCVSKTMQFSNSNNNGAIPEQSDSIDLMEKMEFPSENNGFSTSNSGEKSFEFQFDSQMSSSHENEFNNQLSAMLTDKDYGLVPHVSGTGMNDKTPISQYEANSLSTVKNDMVGDLSQIIAQESLEASPTCAGDAFADGFLRDDYDQLDDENSKKRKPELEPDFNDREQAKRLKINGGNLDE